MARRYEFYFRCGKTIFYERAQRVSKRLFLPRENKIHIFKPPCNVLFLLYRQKDIDKIIDFYSPKSNCDGPNLQYSNIRHCLQ